MKRLRILSFMTAAVLLLAGCTALIQDQSGAVAANQAMAGMTMSGAQTTATPAALLDMEMEESTAARAGMDSGLMHDEPVPSAGVLPATATQGGQRLPFTLDGEVKVFELTAQPVLWQLNADTQATAWSYNGAVPGPLIRVTEGD